MQGCPPGTVRSSLVPKLVDTSIRVISQEPLAGAIPTASVLRLAEVLDRAGFAYLEVSGGGTFDAAVRRGVESPWERIRALKARTKTPLALAIRGRFLVGNRPLPDELVRRFVLCAAQSGITVFRLHDPLNDVENLRVAAAAVHEAGGELEAGLLYGSNRHEALIEAARRLPELKPVRILLDDPAGLLQPHRAGQLVRELAEVSGLPVGLYAQGAGRNGLSVAMEAARAGADLVGSAIYPVALAGSRVTSESAAEAFAGIGADSGVDIDVLWEAAELVDEFIGDMAVAPLSPRIAVRSARLRIPLGIVAAIEAQLRARDERSRLDEVLSEVERVRAEAGSPPLAAPLGTIVASQALVNVLSASRYSTIVDELQELVAGRYGKTPGPIDPALARAVEHLGAHNAGPDEVDFDAIRREAEGLAASEEELLLLALFGEDAEPLLRSIRERAGGVESLGAQGVDQGRADRIRSVVEIVQETGVGEITIEEDGTKISVKRTVSSGAAATVAIPAETAAELDAPVSAPRPSGLVRIESPMVGTFYRSPQPGEPSFVEEGEPVSPGQTLCILEAMKLMNEVKAEIEGIVRKIHVQNGDAVEYGRLLFEIEPVSGPPSL
ncbi:MAG: acetyl-CoA carboxylase biotin carboxyl carrier protein [Actinobacteria bacterium]|uniref:Unannotated protein n=1 Tax=freshwater metagenome TaxID=449393 RepID=A0A6J6PDD5_9ZZZZ|nr:acetyl-CoA carboxylase biotin carboxyl carrier protein [Actinomycetota bacterium]